MRYTDFEALACRLWEDVPTEFLEGVAGLEVSRKTLPHPVRADVYTLGECVPLPSEGGDIAGAVQSQVVLYHGSFAALARGVDDFDWREEVWETLTHELRHHLEWRARAPDLERFDWAAEQNFARGDGEAFDPEFHLSGEPVAEGVFRLDDDFFLDRPVEALPSAVEFTWHGRGYLVSTPAGAALPVFLIVEEIEAPPPGELVVVLRRGRRLSDLFRRAVLPAQCTVAARPLEP
jgi:predicted Zn-dependent protease with MMP-like domain